MKARLFVPFIIAALFCPVSGAQTLPPEASSLTLTSEGLLRLTTSIDRAVPLYWRDWIQRFAIGKVKPDGTLDLRIESLVRARVRMGSLIDWKATHGRNCDVQCRT